MRKRDLGIVLLAVFALFFAVQNEGSFSFREAWQYFRDEETPVRHEAERLPPPLVTDLNGDGRKEVVVATADAKLKILHPHAARSGEGFSEARLLKEVSLLPDKVRVSAGRRPVAMAAGVIHRSFRQGGHKEKQVLVVVTSGWSILCFDHTLKKLWESDVQEHFPHGAHHKEVAISISNYTLKYADQGMVIVGGSMEVQPQLFLDAFEEEVSAEEEAERHRVTAGADEGVEDVTNGTGGAKTRHFSYYAFAGLTGELRWSHRSEDFHRNPAALQDVIPQHNYKLDVASLTSKHYAEKECRQFRESVLSVMPHRWERREDTRLELAHFFRHRRRHHKEQPSKKERYGFQDKAAEKHVPGIDRSNKFVKALGKTADFAKSAKGSGKSLFLSHMITNHSGSTWVPNVVVAHLKEGIEAVHLASGRTLCKLYLTEGGLHADINGDHVLDHVQAVGSSGAERVVPTGMSEVLKPCWAVATSGIPVREQLFDGPICRPSGLAGIFQQGGQLGNSLGARSFGRSADVGPLEVATPALFPRRDGHRHGKGSHGDIIFLNSRGEVTSYGITVEATRNHSQPHRPRWQVATEASWTNPWAPAGSVVDSIVPTLEALPLRSHGPPEVILVAGESEAVILSPSGVRLAAINLPEPPSTTLIYADFSGDGLNDLILVGSDGIYGFVQTRQPGALLFSSLLGFLIVVIVVIFITQHYSGSRGKPRAVDRSNT